MTAIAAEKRGPTTSVSGRTRSVAPVREVTASVALAGFSAATMIGWIRVFDSWDFLTPALVTVFGIHGCSLLLRLVGARPVVTSITTTLFGVWLGLLLQFRSTFRFLLPTTDTLAGIRGVAESVAEAFPNAVAPVPPEPYWIALAIAAACLIAIASDLFAFGAGGIGESLVPGALVFIIVAALGADRHRLELSGIVVMAGVIAVGAIGWHHDKFNRIRVRGSGRLDPTIPTVIVAGIAVGVFAAFAAPYLPGAGGEPVIDPKDDFGGGSQTAPSPLIDIRNRLTEQSDAVMFRVDSERESYWRLTTVAQFDGNTFSFPDQAIDNVALPERQLDDSALVQRVSIGALDGYMVPAAAEPRQAEGSGRSDGKLTLRINFDSATLVAPRDVAEGDSFLVVSQPVDPPPDALREAGVYDGADDVFRSVPDDLPEAVTQTAQDVTAGQGTDYDRLIALQNWFRDSFQYDTEIDLGHSSDAMAEFLSTKRGYCVQFATTFAAMARTLGMPSRVAVGYTAGTPSGGTTRTVTGRNAHAWPEILFEGIGWVAFEPTPGRGIPGAEDYTGVAPQQDTSEVNAPTATTAPPVTAPGATPQTTAAPSPVPVTAAPTATTVGPGGTLSTDGQESGGSAPLGWLVLFAVIVGAVVTLPWMMRRILRANEARLDPRARSQAAWNRCQRSVRRVGVSPSNGSTESWIAETEQRVPDAAAAMAVVGRANDFAVFAPGEAPAPVEADEVSECADEVESVVLSQLDGAERARAWFSLR